MATSVRLPISTLALTVERVKCKMAEGDAPQLPGAYLVWEDMTATVMNPGGRRSSRKLLHGLSGYALPGRLLAIMGPSGSGKSTLLDALAGRLGRNVGLSGTLLLNGQRRRTDYGVVAYVRQENVLLGTLTVRETITFSAHLRLPCTLTKNDVIGIVEATIQEMGLEDCSNRLVGNWHMRGISGGEKKRLCIALEILTKPPLLFLDEPTSGLDSAAAFFIAQTLRQMTRDGNKTIVSSIHQPSSEVFALFDDLYLLSGGEVVYFGDAKMATKFFAEAGLSCPIKRNPSDHFLRCINSDFDRVNATLRGSFKNLIVTDSSSDPLLRLGTVEIRAMLIDRYKSSEYGLMAKRKIAEVSKIEGIKLEFLKGSKASWWKQLKTLTQRSFINMCRDIGYYWLRIIVYIIVSLCVGSIYYDLGTSYTAIWARASCGSFISGFMTFMSIGGFPSFIEEMTVFYHERKNGHYGVAVYTLSNFLSAFPFLVAVSVATASITFFMVKSHNDFPHYAYFAISLYVGISVVESIMMVVASLVPNYLMGIIAGAGIMGIIMMTAGFFRLMRDLPKPVWLYPIAYINYGTWLLQGNYKNDFIGATFDPLFPGDAKLTGHVVLHDMYGISMGHSKWVDLLIAVTILVTYRILFFLIIKINETLSPLLRKAVDTKALKSAFMKQERPHPR